MILLPLRKTMLLAIAAFCCVSSEALASGLIEAACTMQGSQQVVLKYRFDAQTKMVQKLSAPAPQYDITYGQIYPADVTPDKLVIHVQFANRAAGPDLEISRLTGTLAIKSPSGQTVPFSCRFRKPWTALCRPAWWRTLPA
jgi:hypothetical protein